MPAFPNPNFSTDLKGQVALVTGASAGLGVRFAKVLAKCGAKVAICARRIENLQALAKEIEAEGGVALPIAMDVVDAQQIIAGVAKAQEHFGQPVQILVNNAGIPDAQRAHKMSVEFVDKVLGVNLRGPWILACEVARRLIAAKLPGRIVNISSTAHFSYNGTGAALYAVTKTAIARMTEALAMDWAHFGINVNCIAPGAFASEMMDGMLSRVGDITQAFPRKRMGDPAQLDSTLLYLVSPSSEFVTGATIRVDDGQASRANL
ncbi:hypothetical protein DFJ74DRAFT_654730 [Hyaloraphidium curvatum]|nr:hypothetical protein DFJ74DRAFT_654730 [Hyaloraphidium curvatum]